MEQTECSETSAYTIQTPGNYPEESIKHSEHSESLKSRINILYTKRINSYLAENSVCFHQKDQPMTVVLYRKKNNNFLSQESYKHNSMYWNNIEILMLNVIIYIVTTRLWRVIFEYAKLKHIILILSPTRKLNVKFGAKCFRFGAACDGTITYSLVVSSINCHYSQLVQKFAFIIQLTNQPYYSLPIHRGDGEHVVVTIQFLQRIYNLKKMIQYTI